MMTIRPASKADAQTWLAMRCALWPDEDEHHAAEIELYFAGTLKEPAAVFVAESDEGEICGFVELSIRTDLHGFIGQRVGYVEGLYVSPEARGRNVARLVLQFSREWARKIGCTVFASDREDRVIVDPKFSETLNLR